MQIRSGQLVIVAMFGTGVLAALFGVWYRHYNSRRALALWDTGAAVLIQQAPRIDAFEFQPPLEPKDTPAAAGLAQRATRRQDASSARGILNVRQGFVVDKAYAWDQPAPTPPLRWKYALAFIDGDRTAALLFDPVAGVVGNAQTGANATVIPEEKADLTLFFQEQFAPAASHNEAATEGDRLPTASPATSGPE